MPRIKMKLPMGLWEMVTAGMSAANSAPRVIPISLIASPLVDSIDMATSCMLSARRVAVTDDLLELCLRGIGAGKQRGD
jgi:hypothetical protein